MVDVVPPASTPSDNSFKIKELFKSKQKIWIFLGVLVVLLAFLVSYLNSQELSSPAEPESTPVESSKTWELTLSYNSKLKVLSLKKLTLLDQTIRPDYRGYGISPYELFVLNPQDRKIYNTKIFVAEDIAYNILYDSPTDVTKPEEFDSLVYVPYFESGSKIEITKNGSQVLIIALENKTSFNFIPEAIANTHDNICRAVQVVFISDNYTNISSFESFADELANAFRSTPPYSNYPNLFDFKTLYNTQPLNCQSSLKDCLITNHVRIEQIGRASFPQAAKFIVLVNTENSQRPQTDILGQAQIGGPLSAFANNLPVNGIPNEAEIVTETAIHEFLGHSMGALYDRYVLQPQGAFQTANLIPGLRSNCTDLASGEAKWQEAGVTQGHFACITPSNYAPAPANCDQAGNPNILNGGNTNTVMSAGGCNQVSTFDAVEENWIDTVMIPYYLQACPGGPAGPCQIADAYWQPPYTTNSCTEAAAEVITSGNCTGKSIHLDITEDDGSVGSNLGDGDDSVPLSEIPPDESVEVDGTTEIEWQPDQSIADEPTSNLAYEYYFTASIVGEANSFTSTASSNAGKLISVSAEDLGICNSPSPSPSPSGSPTASSSPGPLITGTKTYQCTQDSPNQAGKQLQLKTLSCTLITPTAPPQEPGDCSIDTGQACTGQCPMYLVTCDGGKCTNVVNGGGGVYGPNLTCAMVDNLPYDCRPLGGEVGSGWCKASCLNPGGGQITSCMEKPVIYLYPTEITKVNVSVKTTGQIVVSDPLYPSGGWKNVEAHPDGTLYYQNKKYRELFYETSVTDINPPTSGIVIQNSKLDQELAQIISKLGLNEFEKNEFLNYWLPRLKSLNSPYILFSLMDAKEKAQKDQLEINPKPDTLIEFIAYFKPLQSPISIQPLILPPAPRRVGFTAVEWGGVIDRK
jgi:hypothetical protein